MYDLKPYTIVCLISIHDGRLLTFVARQRKNVAGCGANALLRRSTIRWARLVLKWVIGKVSHLGMYLAAEVDLTT